jgi:hypothetical protein
VLSVEEAIIVNRFVRNMFLFKVFLFVTTALLATIILVIAKRNYKDLVDAV